MNSKLSFAALGLALGVVGAYLLLPPRVPKPGPPALGAFTYHDEPVIVENGSAIVDFNPRDTDSVAAFLDYSGRHLVRGHSNPIAVVRVWTKSGGGQFTLQPCRLADMTEVLCKGDKIAQRAITLQMSKGADTITAFLHWGTKPESGVALFSPTQVFDDDPILGKGNPYRIRSRAGSGPALKLTSVRFRIDDVEQVFQVPTGGKIKVLLCTATDNDHCYSYNPNNPQAPWPTS